MFAVITFYVCVIVFQPLCLVEEMSSSDNKKDSCTINWNDQVPLATIIENLPNEKNDNNQLRVKSLDRYFDFDMKESSQCGESSVQVEPEIHFEIETVEITDEGDDQVELHEMKTVEITKDPVESHEDLTNNKEKQPPSPPPKEPKLSAITTKNKKRLGRLHRKVR